MKGQIAADLESLVELLKCGAGRCPVGDRTPVYQPANLCEADRHLPCQTDQSGLAGRERIGGRTVDCQGRRREAGAYNMKHDDTNMKLIFNNVHIYFLMQELRLKDYFDFFLACTFNCALSSFNKQRIVFACNMLNIHRPINKIHRLHEYKIYKNHK